MSGPVPAQYITQGKIALGEGAAKKENLHRQACIRRLHQTYHDHPKSDIKHSRLYHS